jgi:hypothetical protein
MDTPVLIGDAQEYAEFCGYCGLFLADGLQVWRDALRSTGISDRVIEAKLSSAAKLLEKSAGVGARLPRPEKKGDEL